MNRISEDIKSGLITSLPPKPRTGKRWGRITEGKRKCLRIRSQSQAGPQEIQAIWVCLKYRLVTIYIYLKEKKMNRINLKSTFVLVFSKSSVICTFHELSNRSCIKNTFQILFNTFFKNINLLMKHICRNFSSRSAAVEVDLLCGFKWVLGN